MLYTKKGDNGTSRFGCGQKISKSEIIAEAFGSLDEINSFLGLCKVKARSKENNFLSDRFSVEKIIHNIQQSLFIIQAQLAGSSKKLKTDKIKEMEKQIDFIEKELSPIKTFIISGGSELSTLFDVARTIARRTERKVVATKKEKKVKIQKESLAYLNRLSSLLYALARLTNHKFGINEEQPSYK